MKALPIFLCLLMSAQALIKGISTFGFETEYMALMCSWANNIDWHISKIKQLGFNTIRVPFSYDYIQRGDFQQMDEVFNRCAYHGVDIVLDYHRLHKTHQSFAPYDQEITFDQFLWSWKLLLDRYNDRGELVAVDIWNEYQGDNAMEWNNLSRQIVNFLEYHFPKRFVYFVGGVSWGGNLHDINLEDLSFSDRIRYTIHKYYFSDKEKYEDRWEYSFHPNKTVMNVGEFGYKSDQPVQIEWIKRFISYLRKVGVRDTFFWCWSFNSGDTGGILLEDCMTIDYSKIDMLNTLWSDYGYNFVGRHLRGSSTVAPTDPPIIYGSHYAPDR